MLTKSGTSTMTSFHTDKYSWLNFPSIVALIVLILFDSSPSTAQNEHPWPGFELSDERDDVDAVYPEGSLTAHA